jgi:hypothetical protein
MAVPRGLRMGRDALKPALFGPYQCGPFEPPGKPGGLFLWNLGMNGSGDRKMALLDWFYYLAQAGFRLKKQI